MTCVSPPELDEVELIAHLAGEADEEVEAHLERCPHCAARASSLGTFDANLSVRLDRIDCPTPHGLAEFQLLGESDDARAWIGEHVANCPHCSTELSQLAGFLADTEPIHGEAEESRVRILKAGLQHARNRGDFAALALPFMAGLRGGESSAIVYGAGNVQILLAVTEREDAPDLRSIIGLILSEDDQTWMVSVYRDQDSFGSTHVDDNGNFVLSGVAPGTYDLAFAGTDIEVHVGDFEVGG